MKEIHFQKYSQQKARTDQTELHHLVYVTTTVKAEI
jgi:hypothetical protein